MKIWIFIALSFQFLSLGSNAQVWVKGKNPEIYNPDLSKHIRFGEAMALDGDLLAISAPELRFDSFNDTAVENYGAVLIYKMEMNHDWSLIQVIRPPFLNESSDAFGFSLDLKGSLLIISDYKADHISGTITSQAGLVYVYEMYDSIFEYREYLFSAIPALNGHFGYSLGIGSNYIAISELGASRATNNPGENPVNSSGAVHIFRLQDKAWKRFNTFGDFMKFPLGEFGKNLLTYNNILLISIPESKNRPGSENVSLFNAGVIRSYLVDSSEVRFIGQIYSTDEASNQRFGSSFSFGPAGLLVSCEVGASSFIYHYHFNSDSLFQFSGKFDLEPLTKPLGKVTLGQSNNGHLIIGNTKALISSFPENFRGEVLLMKKVGTHYYVDNRIINYDLSSNISEFGHAVLLRDSVLIISNPNFSNSSQIQGEKNASIGRVYSYIPVQCADSTDVVFMTICDSLNSFNHSRTWKESGIYLDTIYQHGSCLTFSELHIDVKYSSFYSFDTISCGPYISERGNRMNVTGLLQEKMQNTVGCDSIIYTNVEIVQVSLDIVRDGQVLFVIPWLPNAKYEWFDCYTGKAIPMEHGQTFEPTRSGLYGIRGEESHCTFVSTCFFISESSLTESESNLNIGPNPSTGSVQIYFEQESAVHLQLFDDLGRLYISENYENPRFLEFDLPKSNGIYFLLITMDDGERRVYRLVKI